MLVVSGAASPVRASSATACQVRGSIPGSGAGSAPCASASHAQAIRHGWRTARSPPGMPHGPQVRRRARSRRGRRPAARRPTPCRRCRSRCRRRSPRSPGRARRARPAPPPGGRGGAGRRRARRPRAPARRSSTGSRGAGRGRRPPASTAKSSSKCATPSVKERSVSSLRRSPMWWPTQARAPLATQKVLLSSAPQASRPGAASGSASAAGTWPRERRSISGRPADGAHDRVVGARVDRAVVEQDVVGDAGQALARVVVAVGDRLVGDVAARHHERRRGVGSQQVVQRRVGQHHAELGAARGDGAARRARRRAAARARSGARARPAAAPRPRPSSTSVRAAATSRAMSANGPVLAVLARAQPRDRLLVVGAAREVVAAQALDGDDRAVEQRRGGQAQRVVAGRLAQAHGRPAGRARVGLRVEAAVGGVVVLGPAARRTSRSRPSSSAAGRRARRARS